MPVTKPFIKIFGTRENTRAGFMPSTIVWRWSIHKQFWIEFELSINQIICANNCHIMRILCKIERDAVQVSFINYTIGQKFGANPLDLKDSPKNWKLQVFFKTNLQAHFRPEGLSVPEEVYHIFNNNRQPIIA